MNNLSEIWNLYKPTPGVYDEMIDENLNIRAPYKNFLEILHSLSPNDLRAKDALASELFMNQGITFTVYSDNKGIERIFPFDVIPRIITNNEWQQIEKGIQQRLKALNLFLKDIYNEQQIIKDGIIPANLIASCEHYT